MYLRWLCFLPASLAFDVFGRLLTPIVVLFADKDGWLPSWLWWWQTPDNPIDGDEDDETTPSNEATKENS